MKLSTKLLVISELVLLVLVLSLLVPIRGEMRAQVIDDLQNQLSAIAATTAVQIDGDLHEQLAQSNDPNDPAFARLRDTLQRIRDANPDVLSMPDYIYTFSPAGKGNLNFAVMTHGEPFVGDPYPSKMHQLIALDEGAVQASGLYEDRHGEWISAAAPIRNRAGETVGIVEVTQPSSTYFARYDRLILINTVIALVGLAISSLLGYFVLTKLVLRPVREIHEGMQALGRHEFTSRVDIKSKDEFQELGETLNGLFDQLNAAQTIQSSFFPSQMPDCSGYRMAGASEPCDATGGDYYDAFQLDECRTGIVVADVTGHGLGPSLIMASCRSALRALAQSGLEPAALLRTLEEHLKHDLAGGRFITMVYGVVDRDGSFTYANAGHGPALIRSNGEIEDLEAHRPPLGVFLPPEAGNGDPDQSTRTLSVGDCVLLTSDGVSEAQDRGNKLFGVDRIKTLLGDDSLASNELVTHLSARVTTFREGPAKDDVTILAVERVEAD